MFETELINKITIARGKKISSETVDGLITLFQEIGEPRARKIVKELCLSDNLPSNIYGAIQKQANYYTQIDAENNNRSFNDRNYSEADKYPADINSLWKFIEEHIKWHQCGLITETYTSEPIDIDTWVNRGRPLMCCKLHNTWMEGFEAAYKKELCDPESNAIEIFTKAYTKKLIDFRISQGK